MKGFQSGYPSVAESTSQTFSGGAFISMEVSIVCFIHLFDEEKPTSGLR
jgi:hypothetical protein